MDAEASWKPVLDMLAWVRAALPDPSAVNAPLRAKVETMALEGVGTDDLAELARLATRSRTRDLKGTRALAKKVLPALKLAAKDPLAALRALNALDVIKVRNAMSPDDLANFVARTLDVSLRTAWPASTDPEWMMRVVTLLDPRGGVRLACAVVRTVLRYAPKGELRPLRAIEVTERWIEGSATQEELLVAARAAADADRVAHEASAAAVFAPASATRFAAAAAADATYAAYLAVEAARIFATAQVTVVARVVADAVRVAASAANIARTDAYAASGDAYVAVARFIRAQHPTPPSVDAWVLAHLPSGMERPSILGGLRMFRARV